MIDMSASKFDCNQIFLDFSSLNAGECVDLDSFLAIDVGDTENPNGPDSFWVAAYEDELTGADLVAANTIPKGFDGSRVTILADVPCVKQLKIYLQGSGAIDDVKISRSLLKKQPCTDKGGKVPGARRPNGKDVRCAWLAGRDNTAALCAKYDAFDHCKATCDACPCEEQYKGGVDRLAVYLRGKAAAVCPPEPDDDEQCDNADFRFKLHHSSRRLSCGDLDKLQPWTNYLACKYTRGHHDGHDKCGNRMVNACCDACKHFKL